MPTMPIQAEINGKTVVVEDSARQECEVWARVMGYYRPTSEFNIGKTSEHNERHFYTEAEASKSKINQA